ncbi:hypothetical protein SAMN02745133_01559 [Desulforamulus putei DSM 12395]|uniref:Uncharacterized protein n=1 Tax=Desulforamulus putei DSM 12395 TaxID=1121429 RepID=A0A1M4XX94_9FIRM|nr:hypothetical protein SAMN02745133_01559 [Desulforamulus putei DSM 12395]
MSQIAQSRNQYTSVLHKNINTCPINLSTDIQLTAMWSFSLNLNSAKIFRGSLLYSFGAKNQAAGCHLVCSVMKIIVPQAAGHVL